MTKGKKLRIKYTISISIIVLASVFVYFKVIPPDIWYKTIIFVLGYIFAGFAIKTIKTG